MLLWLLPAAVAFSIVKSSFLKRQCNLFHFLSSISAILLYNFLFDIEMLLLYDLILLSLIEYDVC